MQTDKHLHLANLAQFYIGTKEEGQNRGRLVEEFQKAVDGRAQGEPWCAAFCCYLIKEIERMHGIHSYLTLSEHCLTLWNSNEKFQCKEPKPGYLVVWKKKGTTSGHVGIVIGVEPGIIKTVEGNTSDGIGINRDGDGVFRRSRRTNGMGDFVVLGYLDPFL